MPGLKGKVPATDSKQNGIRHFFTNNSVNRTEVRKEEVNKEMGVISEEAENIGVYAKDVDSAQGLSMPPKKKSKLDEDIDDDMASQILKHSHVLKIIDPCMGTSWYSALQGEFKKEYFQQLSEFVISQRNRATIYPEAENVWEWTKHGPIDEVKVVILGQDPYHGPRQAHGLCFSVQKGVPPPPSLVNMYKELESDIEGFVRPKHGHLIGWTQQGVLLLNAVLTVEAGRANSHKNKGWEKLTDAVITWISKNLTSVVFLLWGASAEKKASMVDAKRHHILKSAHPSPLSAHRGFLGCKHFSKCNELLIESGKTPIDWTKLP